MDRRAFLGTLAGGLLAAPLAAETQQLYRIGMLERTSTAINAANLDGFRRGLRELRYLEGKNFVIEYRSADGRDDRFPGLAAELVRLKVDLIVTRGTPTALAAKNATGTIPVVLAGIGDPVGQGVVASLARPGANITGLSAQVTDIYAKRVEILKELVPRAVRLAAILNMSNPAIPQAWREVETAARSLGIQPQLLDVRKLEDLGPAFEAAIRQRADALIVGIDTLTQANQRLLVDLASKHRLPAIYASMEFAGGLVVYGANYPDQYRRAASFADRIFKGAKPADLPIEQPTKFELVLNLKTAKALGLTMPPSLLQRADQGDRVSPLELVIFDCDGVLVDSERIAIRVDAIVLADLGWPLSGAEIIERFVGRSEEHFVREIEAHLGHPLPENWEDAYQHLYTAAFEKELQAVDGVVDALDRITTATCVASSGSHDRIRRSLRLTNLYERFEGRIFSASEVANGKPAPDLFLHAAARLGVPPARCAVVEDSRYGVEAARAAGMAVFAYAGGVTPPHWLEGPRTVVFSDMRALPELLAVPACVPGSGRTR
jgi:putative ABC transport system substrate-binding protein